ncbi:DUF805 domain-containing protein [Pseudohoeflea suaedae]|uniref:DUF805 domain-containing protein n=1 Tax=Pseudohoeflea suaedae TaxID=877384 RepID=A0A4R5PM81_9HYPH|nr:DUF805 domain-containing protein [Pseudohoeflea suaedae]TDH38090.1 DUF805 domain-containing protein [Pseudohoeflea suaedae]
MRGRPDADLRWLLFGMSGRIGRKAFILTILFWFAVLAMPVAMAGRMGASEHEGAVLIGFSLIVAAFLTAWSVLAATVKRLHDIGLPGGWAIALFFPPAALPAILALSLWPTRQGPNRFGAGPEQPGH